MKKIFNNKKVIFSFFILLVFVISYLSFWRAFNFDFWGEDWEQIWFAVFDPAMINNPLEMQHPIVIYEELFLAKILGFNTFYWQATGFLLKVFGAFVVGLMMLGITRSKITAFFTGLIFASSVGGLASFTWVAAHASALVIPFLCLGIYFWVIKRKFILALILLIFSFWADPSRGIFGTVFVIFWEILSILQDKRKLKESRIRIFILLTTMLVIYFIFHSFLNYKDTVSGTVSIGYNLGIVFVNPIKSVNNFLTNIGNLLAGWIIPISQNVFSISKDNIYGRIAGYLFLFQTFFLLIQFLKKRSESLKILLFFSFWVAMFFFPNWLLPNQEMIQNGQVLGVTHRYLTLSAIGVVCYLGFTLSRVKGSFLQIFLPVLVIGSNILMSNHLLKNDAYYRSTQVTKPIWDRIEKDIPPGEENSLFFIRGENKISVNDIAQAKIPFAIRRVIKNRDQWPASTSDPGVVKRYLCGINEDKRTIPLSHLHAWTIKGNSLDNISEKVRKEFSEIDCNFQ